MSLSKDNSHNVKAIETTLLTAEYIHQLQKSRNLVSQAENRAKKIIQAANKTAEIAFQQALAKGFNQGLIASLDLIGSYLCSLEAAKAHLVSTLENDLGEALRKIVGSEDIIALQLTGWAKHQTGKTIRLLIPASLGIQPCDLQEKMQQANIMLTVACHDENAVVAECGDQIFCIDIARFQHKLVDEYIHDSASVNEKADEISRMATAQHNVFHSTLNSGKTNEN